jgi:protein-S-isoprenylcysteine O-methyltransferase Ste14
VRGPVAVDVTGSDIGDMIGRCPAFGKTRFAGCTGVYDEESPRRGGRVMRPGWAIVVLWEAWVVSWVVAAFWASRPETRAGVRAELWYRLVIAAGAAALILGQRYDGGLPLWRLTSAEAWVGVAVVAIGLAFTWWARVHLGRLWSGTVTRKADHRVVGSGPYAIVRHPIYTGLLLALIATAIVRGTVAALVGVALLTIGLWMKARLEETWLRQQLGPEAYDAYRRRVPMLVPFGPTAR